jgi:RecB family exonuclease
MAGSVSTLPRSGAIQVLDRLIAEAQSESPFHPVTVLAPSARVAIHVAKALTTSRVVAPPGPGAGLVNVNFITLARLAEELGTPSLHRRGRTRLTRSALAAAVRVELAARPRIFGEATTHPATAAEVADRYGELRFAGTLEEAPPRGTLFGPSSDAVLGNRAFLLRSVARDVRQRVEASYYDDVDLFESAVERVGAAGAGPLGSVVCYLPDRLRPCELDLLAALGERAPLEVLLGLVGRDDLDEHTRDLASQLGRRLGVAVAVLQATESDPSTDPDLLVTAPTPRAEVRTALRRVLERLEGGTSPERIALLYPVRDPYLALLVTELDAAGVGFNAPAVTELAEEAPGRVVLALADFVVLPVRRHDLVTLLRAVPVLDQHGDNVPVAEWDRVSQLAGITGGPFREWIQHLNDYVRSEQRRAAALAGGSSDRVGRDADGVERNVAAARGLIEFVHRIASLVELGRSARGWAQIGDWATSVIEQLLGPTNDAADASEPESTRAQVRAAIGELARLDAIEAGLGMGAARPLLAEELRRPGSRIGHTGSGVVVASIDQVSGVDFDLAVVVGCSTSNLPGGAPRSPLLERSDREALSLEPMTAHAVSLRSERHFASLRRAAVELVATSPMLDSSGREMAPSRFVEEADSRAAIAGVRTELAQVVLEQSALRSAEFETASLFAHPPREVPAAAAALGLASVVDAHAAVRARDLRAFGSFQGVVGALAAPASPRPHSPTAIEEMANCGYRYFLDHVLGCEVIEDPEVVTSIDPRTKGLIVHEVLERFIAEEIAAFPGAVPEAGERLGVLADEVMDRYERAGLTGKRVLFLAERRRIKLDLEAERLRDATRRQAGRRPLRVEYGFGYEETPTVELAVSSGTLSFRGKIDRADVDDDGAITVIDYKTGRPDRFEVIASDPVDSGRHLQLPIYALAAAPLAGSTSAPVRAQFRFVGPRSAKNGSFEIGIELNDGVRERLIESVDVLTRTVATGLFPMLSGESEYRGYENCRFCEFDKICPSARERYEDSARGSGLADAYFNLLDGPLADSSATPCPSDD